MEQAPHLAGYLGSVDDDFIGIATDGDKDGFPVMLAWSLPDRRISPSA
jgi:hypothetical protein